jgi:hypothetical protein
VDRAAGIIRGVKLLGLSSRNGRRYRDDALGAARELYEGAKVNINHPKGHPLSPRDYQDRLGVIRGVEFRAGSGLFGDLHFNPNHALSEQLIWDAEHAPQNVGLSHNVLARTARDGNETVVEAITKVQSIDLVADPATTSGLYEHVAASTGEPPVTTIASLTLEELRRQRPDLVRDAERAYESQIKNVQARLDAMIAQEETRQRRGRILELLQEHDLPLPAPAGARDDGLVDSNFIETLLQADDDAAVERLVAERAALVRSAWRWNGDRNRNGTGPRSRDQSSLTAAGACRSGADLAAAIRGR